MNLDLHREKKNLQYQYWGCTWNENCEYNVCKYKQTTNKMYNEYW